MLFKFDFKKKTDILKKSQFKNIKKTKKKLFIYIFELKHFGITPAQKHHIKEQICCFLILYYLKEIAILIIYIKI